MIIRCQRLLPLLSLEYLDEFKSPKCDIKVLRNETLTVVDSIREIDTYLKIHFPRNILNNNTSNIGVRENDRHGKHEPSYVRATTHTQGSYTDRRKCRLDGDLHQTSM